MYLSIYPSIHPSIYLICLSNYVSTYRPFYLPIYLSFYLSIYLCVSVSLSIYLSICKLENEALLRDFLIFRSWQHQKRSNSARRLQFLNLTTSKKGNSARLPSKMESWVQSWQPRTNAFCDFSSPPVESTAPATKKWCQVIRSAAPVTQNHLSKPTDLMLQNATPLRKSAPWPPNISDEHVFCTALATRNPSLKILFKCPTPAIVFGNATKPSPFCSAQSLAPATRNDILTSKSGPSP